MQLVLFWDIDGTLLTTGRAGIKAWEGALLEASGVERDLDKFPTAGLIDTEIGRRLLDSVGASPDRLPVILEAYARLLPSALPSRQGQVMPGVREILDAYTGDDRILSLLLTGNLRSCGFSKLRHYRLDHFFSDGAFAEDAEDRPGIARRAHQVAGRFLGSAAETATYIVIGDTPHDITCGQAIGAYTVAVGTGGHALDDLQRHGPTVVFDRLPPPEKFLDFCLGLGR